MINEKLYLFNPFQLPTLKDEEIEAEVINLIKQFVENADTPYEISKNIEIYANLKYFYGEMLSRYTKRHADKELVNNNNEKLETHKLRAEWSKTRVEKAPAISYFEALANKKYEKDRFKENELLEWKTRFRNASDAIEEKMNALKKTIEAMKYEIGLN